MTVLVDFPLAEAQALLKRLGPDGVSMSAAECDAAEAGRKRLALGVKVEVGTGGEDVGTIAAEISTDELLDRR